MNKSVQLLNQCHNDLLETAASEGDKVKKKLGTEAQNKSTGLLPWLIQ